MLSEVASRWSKAFPELAAITDAEWQRAMHAARITKIESGKSVNCADDLFFILNGSISVRVATRSGHEMTLCKVRAGQLCWLNLAVVLGEIPQPDGLTIFSESDVHAAAISRWQIEALLSCRDFRTFVFRELFRGLMELRALVEDIAFGQLDRRIAQCLLDLAKDGRLVTTTHSNIAAELGTAREVVSRQLKEFERHGWVNLHRGQIVIIEKQELQRIVKVL